MIILISSIYFTYVLAKLYISTAEISFVKKSMRQEPVVLDAKAFLEAGKYKISNEHFGVARTLFEYALFLVWIGGGLAWLERLLGTGGTIYESTLFVLIFVAINYILSLPFDLYSTFIKDKKFSNISAKTYILDQIKGALLFVVLGGTIILAIAWIIGNLPLWWIWGFLTIFSVIIFINMIY
ncbi:MAG: M48 family peptidase, partial [Campylobacteraceae bacterium]|nr:M48 family peptidase [Campylobacteraceae bacterium]